MKLLSKLCFLRCVRSFDTTSSVTELVAVQLRFRSRVICCSPRRATELMKTQGLLAIQPKSFKPKTTDSRHRRGYSPNLLLESSLPTDIIQLWVGDITYIPISGGAFRYLATLMDRCSRKIVGWSLGTDMTDALVVAALRMAIKTRAPGRVYSTTPTAVVSTSARSTNRFLKEPEYGRA